MPSHVVNGHGIGEGPIAIKDDGPVVPSRMGRMIVFKKHAYMLVIFARAASRPSNCNGLESGRW